MMLRDVKLAGRHAMRRVSQSPGLFFLFSLLCVVCCCGALSACVHLIIEPLEGFPYMHDDTLENLQNPLNNLGVQRQAQHDSDVCLISQYVNSTVQHGLSALDFCHAQTSSASGRGAHLADYEDAGQVCMPAAGLLVMPGAAAPAADVAIAAVETADQISPAAAACTEGAASDACTETGDSAEHPAKVPVIAAAGDELGASTSAPDSAGTAAAPTDELTADPAATAAAPEPEPEQEQEQAAAPQPGQEQEQAVAPELEQKQEQEQAAAPEPEQEQEQAAAPEPEQEQAAAPEPKQEQAAALHQAVTNAGAVALYERVAASVDEQPRKDSTVLPSYLELVDSITGAGEDGKDADSDSAAEEPTAASAADASTGLFTASLSMPSTGTGMHDELRAAELTAAAVASTSDVASGVAERAAPAPVAEASVSCANTSGIMQLFAALQSMVARSKPTAAEASASPSTCEHQSSWLTPQPPAGPAPEGRVVEQNQQDPHEQQLQQLLAAGTADAGALQGQQLQHESPAQPPWQHQQDRFCGTGTGAELGVPCGGFLSPQLIATAYGRLGPAYALLYTLGLVCAGLLIRAAWHAAVSRQRKRSSLLGLPLSMQRDREAAQAFFTLRELWNHRTAWWRLVGVSGVAVCTAVRAEQHAHSLASKAEGAARFARHLLRRQRQRLVADKDAEKAAALAELQKQLQEAHQDELKCVRTQYEAEAAATSARHLQEVGGLENELQKLRKENLKQADKVLRLQEENGDLKKEVRCKADVISEQRANLGSLGQQLIETKEGKAKVETKLSLMIEQKAIEKGRRETLEAKVKEGTERERALDSKCESVQQQLSDALSTNGVLRVAGQHKDEAISKHLARNQQLSTDKQQLQQDKQQLQQQVTKLGHDLESMREQAAAAHEKQQELQQQSTSLLQQVSSLQTLKCQHEQQLLELQGLNSAAQQQIKQLGDELGAAKHQLSGARSEVERQQQLLLESNDRIQELLAQLGVAHKQLNEDGINMQHLALAHAADEESLQRERAEKQAALKRADELQPRLDAAMQELSQLRSDHTATVGVLQRVQDDHAGLQMQHQAAQDSLSRRAEEVAALHKQLSELAVQLQVAQVSHEQAIQQRDDVQQQLIDQQAVMARLDEDYELLVEECQQKGAKLAEAQQQLQQMTSERDQGRERCTALEEEVADREQLAEELSKAQQQCTEQQAQLAELAANLQAQSCSLRSAQKHLSEVMEQYSEEDLKNRVLGRENGELQRKVLTLAEHETQLEEELEEVQAALDRLVGEHEALQAAHDVMLRETDGQLVALEAVLADNLAKSASLADKLSTAEADVQALTRERDDLSKKLYWAEMARDQTKAAKALAAEDAIKARQALTEEKLRKQTPLRSMSMPGGRGGAAAAAAAGGDVSSARPWQRTNTSQPAKKWGKVEPAYLHQHFKDKDGNIRRCGSPTRSTSNSGSTPGTPRSTATSTAGDSSSTQRGRQPLRTATHNAAAAAVAAAAAALQDSCDEDADMLLGAESGGEQARPRSLSSDSRHLYSGLAAAAAAEGHRRRMSTGAYSSSSSRLQECSSLGPLQQDDEQQQQQDDHQQQQRQGPRLRRSKSSSSVAGSSSSDHGADSSTAPVEPSSSGQSASPGHAVAAAAEGLRRNFSDAAGEVSSSLALAVTAAAADSLVSEDHPEGVIQEPSCTPEAAAAPEEASMDQRHLQQDAVGQHITQQQEVQQKEQQEEAVAAPAEPVQLQSVCSPASTASAMPPLEQAVSPSLCSSKSRTSGADLRDLRPLALSPVQQSSDLVLIGADADSPSISFTSRPPAAADLDTASSTRAGVEAAAESAVGEADRAGDVLEPQDHIEAQASLASVVSGPNTPLARAGVATAGSLEGPSGELQFFTPLPAAAHSSSSTSSPGSPPAPFGTDLAAAGGSSEDGGAPDTPYFTPMAAAAAAAGATSRAAGDTGDGVTQLDGGSAARADGAGVSALGDSSASAAAGEAAAAAGGADGAAGGAVPSEAWWSRLSAGTSHCSSSNPSFAPPHADDDGDVLIGSLSEGDFAAYGLRGHAAGDGQQQQHEQPAGGPGEAELQQQNVQWQQQQGLHSSMSSSTGSSIGSAGSSEEASLSLVALERSSDDCGAIDSRAAVPRLPLFQLNASIDAGSLLAAHASTNSSSIADAASSQEPQQQHTLVAVAAAAEAAGGADWEMDDIDAASTVSASSSGSDDRCGSARCDADAVDGAYDSGQEDSAVHSDLADTPPKMFIASMAAGGAAAAAAAMAAAAAVAGNALNSPRTMHSPRYQKPMHSPRYQNQQQQQQERTAHPDGPVQQEGCVAAVAAAAAAGMSAEGEDVCASTPDVAPRSTAAAPSTGAVLRSSSKSRGGSPATSPAKVRTAAAAAGSSPPSAGAQQKQSRRSSRLSDPTSSSCSSIKSLVAHSRQQQQQQMRRTGSNSSLGSGPHTAVLSVGSPGSGADQQGLRASLAATQQQQQQWKSPGSSPGRSIAATAASRAAALGSCEHSALQDVAGSINSSGADTTSAESAAVPAVVAAQSPSARAAAPPAAAACVEGCSGQSPLQQSANSSGSGSSQELPQQQWPPPVCSPTGTCSPVPSCIPSMVGFTTPPGPSIPPHKAATVGPPGAPPAPGYSQHRSSVMWKSLDDFVHATRASSVSSSTGVRWAGGVGSSMAGLPPYMSPPAATAAAAGMGVVGAGSPYASPPGAMAGLRSSSYLSPPAAAGVRASVGSPYASLTASTGGSDGAAAVGVVRQAALTVTLDAGDMCEGECEGEPDSPDSCSSGGSAEGASAVAGAAGVCEGAPTDAWVVQENPVYFEL